MPARSPASPANAPCWTRAPELIEWADRLDHCMQDTLAAELRRSAREAEAARAAEQGCRTVGAHCGHGAFAGAALCGWHPLIWRRAEPPRRGQSGPAMAHCPSPCVCVWTDECARLRQPPARCASTIHCAARSAIISVGELVLPLVMVGISRIHHAQALDAAHTHLAVQHRHGVLVVPHLWWCPRGGRWWWQCRPPAAPGLRRVWYCTPGFHSSGWYFGQRGLGHDAARDAQAVGGHLAVFGGAQVVGGQWRARCESRRS